MDTWALRPEATTAIPNLFLASDYVRTYTDLATMEGANEAARRAVNGVLEAEQFDGARCEVWPLHELEVLAPWRLYDAARFEAGLPWDDSLVQVAAEAMAGASPLLDRVIPLLERVSPFVSTMAGAVQAEESAIEDASEVRDVDPTVKVGSAYVPTPQYLALDAADEIPGAGDLVGPGGVSRAARVVSRDAHRHPEYRGADP